MKSLLWPDDRDGRANALVGLLVFVFSLAVYVRCLTPTVPFWDSGEFIATAYRLGIPHPPGTPLYVLIGRVFSLLPFGSVAVRVNFLSAFFAAVAVLFTYLIAVRLIRRNYLADEVAPIWPALVGGAVAAFFTAWGTTFWDNSIEAEVYSTASAIMCLCVWLALLWWERQGEPQNDRLLWAILYVLFLSIGVHLGSFLVFPCIYLLVTMVHWGRVKKGWFWGSVGLFLAAVLIRTAVVSTIDNVDSRIVELTLAPESVQNTASFMSLVMLLAVVGNLFSVLGFRFTVGIGVLALLGVSNHLYLLIRAGLHPSINEADPSNLHNLWLMLTRDQYKPQESIFRKAPVWYQFSDMYLRYLSWQFQLFGSLANRSFLIPIAIGLFGAITNAWREKKSFFLMLTLFLITGPFLVWYLNFKQGEVRERDYFFVANFHFFAVWVGMGAAALVAWVGEGGWRRDGVRRVPVAAALTAALLLVIANLPLIAGMDNQNFFRHDRRGNYVARDFAHNVLAGLEPNAILLTNGDNDTFPLWYLQEVEGFRKDVRVLCLSLLNTEWFIRQARDQEPKVPITLTDDQILALQPYRDEKGKIVYVKDLVVRHILETNRWRRPVYLAVTVPEQMGLDKQLVMEGLVFRVYPQPQKRRVDVARTRKNLHEVYSYRGFLTASGDWDASVYKDTETTHLLQNYAAASVQLSMESIEDNKPEEALAELERARKMSPEFPGVVLALGYVYERLGRYADAAAHYEAMRKQYPDDPQIVSQLGFCKAQLGDTTAAIDLLERAIQVDPSGDFNPYAHLVNILYARGNTGRCDALLEQWLRHHPDDQRARNTLEFVRRGTGSVTGSR